MPSPAVDQPQPPGASQHAWPSDRDLATLREDVAAFAELHGVPADPRDVRVAVAPYRVCPLGAHVDHQGGRVAGMALDCGVLLGFLQAPARKTGADRDEAHRTETETEPEVGASEVLLRSDAFAGEVARFDVTRPDDDIPGVFAEAAATDANDTETSRSVKEKEVGKSWEKYARGAAWVLADDARLRGSPLAARRRGRREVLPAWRAHGRRRAQLLRSDHCRVCHGTPARERTNGGGARAFEGGGARRSVSRRTRALANVARLARRAENERVGVRCGVLDQASIALAERDALTLIDCAGETHARIRLGADREGRSGFAAEPCDADGPRTAVQNHARVFGPQGGADVHGTTRASRSAARRRGGCCAPQARPTPSSATSPRRRTRARKRASPRTAFASPRAHFFGEAKRVADGELLWRRGDLRAFGALVTESGVSSVENYECGCAPMNALRAIVCATRGVFGARFSGAGFRGCVVGLADTAEAEAAAKSVREAYSSAFPELAGDAGVALVGTGDGARIIERDDSDT